MRKYHSAIITSVAVHAIIIALVMVASPAAHTTLRKIIQVDISLLETSPTESSAPQLKRQVFSEKQRGPGGAGAPRTMDRPNHPARSDPEKDHSEDQAEPPAAPVGMMAADALGEKIEHGIVSGSPGSSGSAAAFHAPGGSGDGRGSGRGKGPGGGQGGGGSGGQGSGDVLAGGRDYGYIREAILKNVRYPEEAMRLGIEGNVLLSFIVLENGRTSDVKVIESSGSRLLDQSAKEAVATTRIDRRVPFRVVVHLPITYKLRGREG